MLVKELWCVGGNKKNRDLSSSGDEKEVETEEQDGTNLSKSTASMKSSEQNCVLLANSMEDDDDDDDDHMMMTTMMKLLFVNGYLSAFNVKFLIN